jgi:CHAD domain-containing protein
MKSPKTIVTKTIRHLLEKVVHITASVATKPKNGVERIHRLRTETRRADAALRLFIDWLPQHPADRLRQKLTDIRRKASSVRDFDVLKPIIESLSDRLPVEAMEFLRDRAITMQKKRANSLQRFCRRLIERRFERKVRALTHRVVWRGGAVPLDPQNLCLSSVERLAERFEKIVQSLSGDTNQLHAVRIQGRRIRYTLELVQAMSLEFATKPVCEQLTQLQDSVGHVNDEQSALRFLRACQVECHDHAFAIDLERVVAAFEVTINEQMRIVIQNTLEQAGNILARLRQLIQVNETS